MKFCSSILALICVVFFASNALAQASLGYSPNRIVIGDRDRSATITLSNRGSDAATYRVTMLDSVYNDDGSVSLVDETPSGFPSAKPHLRFSPSQVRLDPGQSQNVRVLVRSRDLADGEYRVHAQLMAIPDREQVAAAATEGDAVSGTVGLNQAVALAIILRRGQTSATGRIDSAIMSQDRSSIDVTLGRDGNQSLYLDLQLFDASNDAEPVALARGIAVPVPNRQRFFRMGLGQAIGAGAHRLVAIDHYTQEPIATFDLP